MNIIQIFILRHTTEIDERYKRFCDCAYRHCSRGSNVEKMSKNNELNIPFSFEISVKVKCHSSEKERERERKKNLNQKNAKTFFSAAVKFSDNRI